MDLSNTFFYRFRATLIVSIAAFSFLLALFLNTKRGIGESVWTIHIANVGPQIRNLRVSDSNHKNVTVEVERASPDEVVMFPCMLRSYVQSDLFMTQKKPDVSTVRILATDFEGTQTAKLFGISILSYDSVIIKAKLDPVHSEDPTENRSTK